MMMMMMMMMIVMHDTLLHKDKEVSTIKSAF